MKKYVISLEDSPRLETFMKQKDAQGFEIFSAFDSRRGEGAQYFDIQKFAKYHSKPAPSGAEMGCALSHYLVIKEFAEMEVPDSEYLLIAEDDARFSIDFQIVLNRLLSSKRRFDYVILADAFGREAYGEFMNFPNYFSHLSLRSKIFFLGRGNIYRIGKFSGNPWGTGLYLISWQAAKKFVEFVDHQNQGIWWLADDYDLLAERIDINFFHLKPAIADFEVFDDSINLNILTKFSVRMNNLINKNPKNILRYILRKFIKVFYATYKDII